MARTRPRREPGPARERTRNPQGSRTLWLYGRHAVRAAVQNPRRRIRRLLVASEAGQALAASFGRLLKKAGSGLAIETVARDAIDHIVGGSTSHQGVALATEPLPGADLDALCRKAAEGTLAVGLDRVTDPQNVGAVLRSAAAFGAAFLVMPKRHSPGETAALAKAASGALETVPIVRAPNLRRAIGLMQGADFVCLGLDPKAPLEVAAAVAKVERRRPIALVFGAEGAGLREQTRAACDFLVSIPIRAEAGSLNVSAASAIALHEVRRITT